MLSPAIEIESPFQSLIRVTSSCSLQHTPMVLTQVIQSCFVCDDACCSAAALLWQFMSTRQSLKLHRCRLPWRRSSSTMRGSMVALHMLCFISTYWHMVSQQPALATTPTVSVCVFVSQIRRSSFSSLLSLLSYMHLPDICPNMYRNRTLDVPIVYWNCTAYAPKLHKQNWHVPNTTSSVPQTEICRSRPPFVPKVSCTDMDPTPSKLRDC